MTHPIAFTDRCDGRGDGMSRRRRRARRHEVRLCGDPPALPDGDEGPDLRCALDWEAGTVPAGEFVVNAVGSVHQSFTEGDGALIVVLWSGCHANVRPEKCPSSNLLRPGAGWAD